MKILLPHKYTRWQRRKLREEALWKWHRKFAWFPVEIPAERHDSIVVPRHLLWLEYYEREKELGKLYNRRTYRGAPSLRQVMNQ